MNTVAKTVVTSKNFVRRHKTGVAVAATATVAFVIHTKIVNNWNEFLEENDLMEQYYHFNEI